MLFQNKSFEVCSNRTLSEKYCQKRTEAVKRVLMCAEACMPLHCHSNSLNPLHSCRTTSSLGVSGTTVIGFYLNNPDTIFGYLHLVIRLTNPILVPSKRYVQQKHSVFRERSSAPRYLQLRLILLNQLNFVQSRLHSVFGMRDKPLYIEDLTLYHVPTVGSSCSK